ncbi:hydroxyproline dehydrogenase [Hypanus sabinus]|uniref:hydroxyproline dehydrogenase n=1 Tax=Hypanus sabinus TaxID=79690 RepID=UPI0028C4D2D7|nr:hydroxyproline dehydrogenase [Hypanus sabinus]
MLLSPARSRCHQLPFPTVRTLCRKADSSLCTAPPGSARRAKASPDFDTGAYRVKSNWELLRALLVFRMCSFPWLVNNAGKVMHWSCRLLGRRLFEQLMKVTVYGQFVAGETVPEVQGCTEALRRAGVRPMLAVPIEEDAGEDRSECWFEGNLRTALSCVDTARVCSPHAMMQLKVTALMGARLCTTVSRSLSDLSTAEDLNVSRLAEVMDGRDLHFRHLRLEESVHLHTSLRRLRTLAEYAQEKGVPLLIDAELTSLNPAISLVTKALMLRFNQSEPLIWNTYQCYLQDTERQLLTDVSQALSLGLWFGVKLVRGAYMDRERELALKFGYPDPVQKSWDDTDQSYRRLLDQLVTLVKQNPRVGLVAATHNEGSVRYLLNRMEALGLGRDCGIHSAQLLGMCDHISLTLGRAGYSVYKSLPYGDVSSVIPYLVRRAQENQSALRGIRRERELLRRELNRRLLLRRGLHD